MLAEFMVKCDAKFAEIAVKPKIDAVAYSGSSGAALAFYLAYRYHLSVIYVRKDKEDSHGNKVECNAVGPIRKYLIVDDFISTASTIRRIIESIDEIAEKRDALAPKPVGIMLYETNAVNRTAEETASAYSYNKIPAIPIYAPNSYSSC